MISPDEALARILTTLERLGNEQVALREAAGRFLRTDVAARVTQPPFAVSAMDGYAVHGADVSAVPITLTQIGEVPAGSRFEGEAPRGTCVRIFTGGRLPGDLDTVVIQENVTADGDKITLLEAAPLGAHVRRAGADFSEGDMLLKGGCRLSPRDVALAAAMNVDVLTVTRRPTVAILSTGNELALPGGPVGDNQILSSNAFGLAAQVEAWGGIALDLGIAKDTEEDLRAKAALARHADFFVTIGGASVGDHDLIQKVLTKDGLQVDFWKIAQKPGKPLIFGRYGDVAMMGLPGNPVSALVCAQLYLKPALFALQGAADPAKANEQQMVLLGADLPANDSPRQDYMRATLSPDPDGRLMALPARTQDSGQLATLARADCLLIRPPHAEPAKQGDTARALLLT
ncbi:MAG: molybdopterin molybdenumtransferase MoeA [Alphaproteobacteria bacterium]|nr:MAG: molybdopterin molybdenumtransferase MoeA [Alphaproteobacteria bacterium]